MLSSYSASIAASRKCEEGVKHGYLTGKPQYCPVHTHGLEAKPDLLFLLHVLTSACKEQETKNSCCARTPLHL